ncbi:TadE/TadG family type IV pilus assembly protein [Actinacidiphila sp. ITFR-21]|uniref:TadE/TadG family type IV pilus assembly protein n=1 Tax=Actinacidiphila sp. ITFR-21 TaxID=3075199 RepID=UPI00288A783F|nr:TadE/TadG family type IV pilus assembly protein [Streptomyces sp. ITFR-21]WNI15965.1 TadE/TadG family type IV pilus assembly protein [Streptomyces sp. ITFR-21]
MRSRILGALRRAAALRHRTDGRDGHDDDARARARARGCGCGCGCGDRGLSTIEVVILAPVMILFILVLVAFGQLVGGRGALDGAARDAARAGSLQRERDIALRQAKEAAENDLGGTCVDGTVSVRQVGDGGFRAGSLFQVRVSCTIRGLGSLGLDIDKTLTSTAVSPIDPYHRTVPD